MGSKEKKHFSFIKLIILLVIAGLFLILGLSIYNKESSGRIEYPAPVLTILPRKGLLQKTLNINSYIETDNLVTLSPRISGTIISLPVKMGDSLTRGQLVATVDPASYELTSLQARATFLNAESTFTRIESLFANNAATQQNYDEAKARYEAAKSQVELAELNLEYTKVRSPLDGAVLETHINSGALAGPETPLVTIGDLNSLIVKIRIPEQNYSFFLEKWESMDAFMEVPALENRIFILKITAIASYVNIESKSFQVQCGIEGDITQLRPGMFVRVGFVTESREDTVYLPFQVFASNEKIWYVDLEGKARFMIYHSDFSNDEFFSIPHEYEERLFILEGQHFIETGKDVNILEEHSWGK